MATYCALHVASASVEGVRDAVLDWMRRQHGATAIRETLQSRLPRDYYANFLIDEDAVPEMFIVGGTRATTARTHGHCLAAVEPRAAVETIPRPWWRFWD